MMRARGFTMIELVVATALLLVLVAAVFSAIRGAPEALAVQSETADMHQRLRVAAGTLMKDLVASSGVRPYRWGGTSADPPGTFKTDTITAVGTSTTTYWLKTDDVAAAYQLMSYAGGTSADVPVVDHVVALTFEYFAAGLVPLSASELTDGPWLPDASAATRWDADLARVRMIAIALRVQSAITALRGPAGILFAHGGIARDGRRWAPDIAIHFCIAPRNLNLGN
jgi:prepilin-type N-terminal cleavage/methylation domain-containing protein